jgi:exodeoxyribonuclease VII small subunit
MEEKETYDDAAAKLRVIAEEMEKGTLNVDELSEKMKEASRLIKLCRAKLFRTDEEVRRILEELDA